MREFWEKLKAVLRKAWNWLVSIPQDKLLHDYAGNLICIYFFAVFAIFMRYWNAMAVANIVAVLVLICKEIYDKLHPETHTAECADVAYGLFGVLKADIAILLLAIAFA